jgi:hypothetical protein
MKRHAAAYLVAALAFIFGLGVLLTHNTGCSVLVPPEVSGQDPKVTAAEIAKWEGIVAFYQNRVEVLRLVVEKPGSTSKDQKTLETASYFLRYAQGVLQLLKPPTTQPAI